MRLAVFGASGRTGRPLVEQALARGHEVRALVRDPAKLPLTHDRLALVRGDVLSAGDVADTVAGCDAVLQCGGDLDRVHAALERIGEDWTVVDDGLSHNGTYLNGSRVTSRQRLKDGDVLTVGGVLFGELLAGAVITETVFGLNGIGSLTEQAVNFQDVAVLQAIVVLSAAAFVTVNLLVDLLYPILDPRLKAKPETAR